MMFHLGLEPQNRNKTLSRDCGSVKNAAKCIQKDDDGFLEKNTNYLTVLFLTRSHKVPRPMALEAMKFALC